jgi:hypothetical protein
MENHMNFKYLSKLIFALNFVAYVGLTAMDCDLSGMELSYSQIPSTTSRWLKKELKFTDATQLDLKIKCMLCVNPNLKSLTFECPTKLEDAHLKYLSNVQRLDNLCFNGCKNISNDGILNNIASNCYEQKPILEKANVNNIDIPLEKFKVIKDWKLQSICFIALGPSVTIKSLLDISNNCSTLSSITVENCAGITDESELHQVNEDRALKEFVPVKTIIFNGREIVRNGQIVAH